MKTISFWKNTLIVMVLLAVLFPIVGKAGPMGNAGPMGKAGPVVKASPVVKKGCSNLPLSQFLKAQGTSTLFFPPVADYVGWTDHAFTTFALVDYAGLANEYIKVQPKSQSLRTKVRGYVEKCALANNMGRDMITVFLSTERALGFAQSIRALESNNFDFLSTHTIFGAKAQDVVNGADAAIGPATLSTTFFIARGAALPDIVDVLVNRPANYAPINLIFTSTTFGRCYDGREAHLYVNEVASTNDNGELIFSEETVEAVDINGNNCVY